MCRYQLGTFSENNEIKEAIPNNEKLALKNSTLANWAKKMSKYTIRSKLQKIGIVMTILMKKCIHYKKL